jgi:hypothetical protein
MKHCTRRITSCTLLSCALAVTLPATLVHAHGLGAHVHGTANLQVAVEGNTLSLDMDTPLDNLLGFEHEPRDDKQKAAVRRMAQTLRDAAKQFVLSPAARCTLVSVHLESSVLDPKLLGEDSKPQQAAKQEEAGHADLDAGFAFRCASPKDLHDVEVRLFDRFHNLHQIDVQLAGPHGQAAAKLDTKQRRLSW